MEVTDGRTASYELQERIRELERLCLDMYKSLDKVTTNLEAFVGQPMRMLTDESGAKTRRDLNCCRDRMGALGLLEGESHDKDIV